MAGLKPEDFAEAFRLKAVNLAEAEGDAMRAEKKAKRVFSQVVISAGESVAKGEHMARIAEPFTQAEDEMIEKQTRANVLKAELESMRISWETWRSISANKRAEMRL